jgi:hypothetical protein
MTIEDKRKFLDDVREASRALGRILTATEATTQTGAEAERRALTLQMRECLNSTATDAQAQWGALDKKREALDGHTCAEKLRDSCRATMALLEAAWRQ